MSIFADVAGDPLISLPTQCTEMDINGTEQMRQDGHIPLPSPRLVNSVCFVSPLNIISLE